MKKSIFKYEAGQESVTGEALTTEDNVVFSSLAKRFSKEDGFEPSPSIDGVITGGDPSIGVAVNVVNVAALTCNLTGTKYSVSADSLTVARPTVSNFLVSSVVFDGTDLLVIQGTEGSSFAASTVRGSAGSAPYIPVGSIEICQVKYSSQTDAVLTKNEISRVNGVSVELATDPFGVNYEDGTLTFATALKSIHTGDTIKSVKLDYAQPVMVELFDVTAYASPRNAISLSSIPTFSGPKGSQSVSLSSGSFSVSVEDRNAHILSREGKSTWIMFKQKKTVEHYEWCQGSLSLEIDDQPDSDSLANFTIVAEKAATFTEVDES